MTQGYVNLNLSQLVGWSMKRGYLSPTIPLQIHSVGQDPCDPANCVAPTLGPVINP